MRRRGKRRSSPSWRQIAIVISSAVIIVAVLAALYAPIFPNQTSTTTPAPSLPIVVHFMSTSNAPTPTTSQVLINQFPSSPTASAGYYLGPYGTVGTMVTVTVTSTGATYTAVIGQDNRISVQYIPIAGGGSMTTVSCVAEQQIGAMPPQYICVQYVTSTVQMGGYPQAVWLFLITTP